MFPVGANRPSFMPNGPAIISHTDASAFISYNNGYNAGYSHGYYVAVNNMNQREGNRMHRRYTTSRGGYRGKPVEQTEKSAAVKYTILQRGQTPSGQQFELLPGTANSNNKQ
jgi:hypothetical protein